MRTVTRAQIEGKTIKVRPSVSPFRRESGAPPPSRGEPVLVDLEDGTEVTATLDGDTVFVESEADRALLQ